MAAPGHEDKIMHAQLETPSGYTLMASDAPPGMETSGGSDISVSLSGDDAELREYFTKLSDGGAVTMPLEKQVWGDEFGMCTDRFGISWMVNISQPAVTGKTVAGAAAAVAGVAAAAGAAVVASKSGEDERRPTEQGQPQEVAVVPQPPPGTIRDDVLIEESGPEGYSAGPSTEGVEKGRAADGDDPMIGGVRRLTVGPEEDRREVAGRVFLPFGLARLRPRL